MATQKCYCSFRHCQRPCPEGQRYCCKDHESKSTICWLPSCNRPRYRHENGCKAPGCSKSHTVLIKEYMSCIRCCTDGKLTCCKHGRIPSTCERCHPDDMRDVAHYNIITGEECYCYSCLKK